MVVPGSRKRPRRALNSNPLKHYDAVRSSILGNLSSVYGEGESSVIEIPASFGDETTSEEGGETVRLIHVPILYGLSRGGEALGFMHTSAKGALLAVKHFNERDESVVPNLKEILEGCDLHMTVDYYDTERSERVAAKVLTRQIFQLGFPYTPTAIAGAIRSAVSIPLATLTTVRNLPQISYASTSSTLNNNNYELFGRTISDTDGDANALVQYFNELGVTHFGILYVQDDYGTATRLSFERAANKYDISIAAVAVSLNQDGVESVQQEIRRALLVLKETRYRYLVGILFTSNFQALVDEATDVGIMGPGFTWMMGDGVSTSAMSGLRIQANSSKVHSVHGVGFIRIGKSTQNGHFQRFEKALLETDGTADFKDYYAFKTPIGSDIVQFPVDHNVTADGISAFPPLSYDCLMAIGIAGCRVSNRFFDGKELYNSFLTTEFDGASGPVAFDDLTGSRSFNTTAYYILNTIISGVDENGTAIFSTVVAANYYRRPGEAVKWHSNGDVRYNYSDFSLSPHLPLPPVDFTQEVIETSAYILMTSLAIIVMLSSLVFATWTWWYRRSHVVRASQPVFLILICVGVFLMAISAILSGTSSPPFSSSLAGASCMLSYWFFCIGFGISFSAVYAKTRRINKILNSTKRFRRVRVKPKDVVLAGTTVLVANVVTLLVWQLKDPLRYEDVFSEDSVDEYGRPNRGASVCKSEGNAFYYQLPLFIINAFAIVAANYQAFRARNLTTEFSESKYIGLAMAIIMQASLVAIPVVLWGAGVTTEYLIESALILIASGSVLYIIFIPKVNFWRQREDEIRLRSNKRAEWDSTGGSGGRFTTSGSNQISEASNMSSDPSDLVAPIESERDLSKAESRKEGLETSTSDQLDEPSERAERPPSIGLQVLVTKGLGSNSDLCRMAGDRTNGLRVVGRRSIRASANFELESLDYEQSSESVAPRRSLQAFSLGNPFNLSPKSVTRKTVSERDVGTRPRTRLGSFLERKSSSMEARTEERRLGSSSAVSAGLHSIEEGMKDSLKHGTVHSLVLNSVTEEHGNQSLGSEDIDEWGNEPDDDNISQPNWLNQPEDDSEETS